MGHGFLVTLKLRIARGRISAGLSEICDGLFPLVMRETAGGLGSIGLVLCRTAEAPAARREKDEDSQSPTAWTDSIATPRAALTVWFFPCWSIRADWAIGHLLLAVGRDRAKNFAFTSWLTFNEEIYGQISEI